MDADDEMADDVPADDVPADDVPGDVVSGDVVSGDVVTETYLTAGDITAEDVMSSPVVTVRADTPLVPAAALLAAHGFTAAPVLGRRGTLIGIVTELDLIRGRFAPSARSEADTPTLVEEVMTTPVETVRRDEPVSQVASLMLRSYARSVPVVDKGELVGVVTRRDLLRLVARHEETSAEVRRRRGVRSRRVPR